VKAVIYARFSSDNQREESITAQVRACTEYARRQSYSIEKIYTDEARSATTDDRPGFLQMIEEIKSRAVETNFLLVHKLDRFARNRYDSAVYRKTLATAGVRLIAADQPLDDSPESVLLESLLEGLAEYYSRNLAREVMKGMKENAYQAKFNGGWSPLGFDIIDGRYAVNEKEAPIVRLIFSMFLQGHGYRKIQDKLNDLGYLTGQGKPFGKNSIYEILRNVKYAGFYSYNRAPRKLNGKRNWRAKKDGSEIITLPGAVPAIISEEDFNKVQEIMNARKKTGPRQKSEEFYFLTGKVVCGECGAAMVGNSSRRKAGAEPSRYYECNRKMRTRDCKSRRVPKGYLENYVLDIVQQDMFSPENMPELARKMVALAREKSKQNVQEESSFRDELAEVERKIENIVKAIEDGADYEILGGRLTALKKNKQELKDCLDSLRSPLAEITEEMVLKYLSATQNDIKNRPEQLSEKKIVDLYVHEIKVFSNKIDVTLKLNLGADKDGVGGPTLLYPHTGSI
jgi:site-specific DNA recombinase